MADTPLFFIPQTLQTNKSVLLPGDTARHIVQVLRMQAGDAVSLTDGKGTIAFCTIEETDKKKTHVGVKKIACIPKPSPALHLAIAFTKNASRNEWLLEKATELGVSSITPLITERSIRDRIRADRWNTILISAMIQSKQAWLPELRSAAGFDEIIRNGGNHRLIAHCMGDDEHRKINITKALKKGDDLQIFIGPEGDFTPAEVTLAVMAGAVPVSLGDHRLRTETAALAAITLFYLTNYVS